MSEEPKTKDDQTGVTLDVWEANLADGLTPEEKPHAMAIVCKDGTVVTFVGPHAFVLSVIFLGAIEEEHLTDY